MLNAAPVALNTDPVKRESTFLRSRSRSASSCCRGWHAGCRDVRQPFSYCRDILQAPEESCFARHHRDSALPFAGERHALSVPKAFGIELRRAAPLHQSSPAAPAPPHIQLHSAIPAHFPARRNPVTFETRLARCLVRASRVVEQTV